MSRCTLPPWALRLILLRPAFKRGLNQSPWASLSALSSWGRSSPHSKCYGRWSGHWGRALFTSPVIFQGKDSWWYEKSGLSSRRGGREGLEELLERSSRWKTPPFTLPWMDWQLWKARMRIHWMICQRSPTRNPACSGVIFRESNFPLWVLKAFNLPSSHRYKSVHVKQEECETQRLQAWSEDRRGGLPFGTRSASLARSGSRGVFLQTLRGD
jgi:hypothetical protein